MVRPARFGIGKLGLRLALAFLGVALTAIIVLAGLDELTRGRDTNGLVAHQESVLSQAITLAAAASYNDSGWNHRKLDPVLDLANREGVAVEVRDVRGNVVGATPGFAHVGGIQVFRDSVIMHGKLTGSITVKFGPNSLGSAASQFESERLRTSIGAAGIVALVALVVSLLISRQITLPLERVLVAIRARGIGDRSMRVGDPPRGTGVVHELAVALNESSDAIDQRDRLQKNLVANIAHELRTPVAILQASHEAMLDGVTPPTIENLWSLRDEVLRLARMIDDLQRLAAAEAAALQLKVVPQDLSGIAAASVASLSDSFGAAGVNLVRRLNPAWVLCDPDRMREVVTNLLTNALKFTPAGGTVEVVTSRDGRGPARLTVSDTGIGIPSDELPRVTERFFRGQRSAEMATGSGIGLTIVAELVRAQNGHLYISSEPGIGTQAVITLPGANAISRSGHFGRSRYGHRPGERHGDRADGEPVHPQRSAASSG